MSNAHKSYSVSPNWTRTFLGPCDTQHNEIQDKDTEQFDIRHYNKKNAIDNQHDDNVAMERHLC